MIHDIRLPDTLTSIGQNAFSGCRNLTSISIPYNVTSLGASAFYTNFSLTTFTKIGSNIAGEGTMSYSGTYVSMSMDGLTVAICSLIENSTRTGQVRVYKYRTVSEANWNNYTVNSFTNNSSTSYKPIVVNGGDATPISGKKYWVQLGCDIGGEAVDDTLTNMCVSLNADGTYVAIGASNNDGNGTNSGHVRVYKYTTISEANWNNYTVNSFTNNSSTSYKPIVVNGADTSPVSGKFYWVQMGSDINGEATDNWSGYSISLSSNGTVVAIGATQNAGTSLINNDSRGHVRIYQYSTVSVINWNNYTVNSFSYTGSSPNNKPIVVNGADANPIYGKQYWVQMGADIDGETQGDRAGRSVSLNANGYIIAIGAAENTENGTRRGHTRVFQYRTVSSNEWSNYTYDSFLYNGTSPNNKPILVGGGDTTPVSGKFYWVQIGGDINGETTDDQSGFSVSLSSDGYTVAIGAYMNDTNGENSGHVRIYNYNTISDPTWSNYTINSFTNDNTTSFKPIVVNGTDTAPVSGKQYWVQMGSDINGETAGDWSGYSVSLSANGSVVAIGAYNNGGNGTQSGHVRIYQYKPIFDATWTNYTVNSFSYTGSSPNNKPIVVNGADANPISGKFYWVQIGGDINGEAAGEWSGYSVSLSADGSTVAIGALVSSSNGSNSGVVRVYSGLSSGTSLIKSVQIHERLYNIISQSFYAYFQQPYNITFQIIPALLLTNTLNPSKLTISQINNLYIRQRQSQLGFCTKITVAASYGDGILRASDITTALAGTTGFVHLDISTNVTSINGEVCLNNTRIYSVAIPKTVVTFGTSVFNGCLNLSYLSFHPDSVCTTIGDSAFLNTNIIDLTLPDSLTTILGNAFRNSKTLTSVCIPKSVTTLGNYAFLDCPKLTSVILPTSLPLGTYGNGTYFSTSGTTPPGTITSYSTTSDIPHFKLSDFSLPSGIVQNVIDSSVNYIDHLAYHYYPDLTLYSVSSRFNQIVTSGPFSYHVNKTEMPAQPASLLINAVSLTTGGAQLPIYRSIPDLNVYSYVSGTVTVTMDNLDDFWVLYPGYSMVVYSNLYDEENISVFDVALANVASTINGSEVSTYIDNQYGTTPLNVNTSPDNIATSVLILYNGKILSKVYIS